MHKQVTSGAALLTLLGGLFMFEASQAHHSFAPYDIRNAIEISGTAREFVFRRPHPRLVLVDDGGVSWEVEVPVMNWNRAGLAPDAIEAGDELVVRGFPARSGAPEMAMAAFEKNGKYYSVNERIRQRSANEAADAIEAGEALEDVLERYPEPE